MVIFLGAGLHWTAIQSVAWVQMMVTYSQEASLAEAISMTFDGDHPCELCELVKTGQQKEKKDASVKPQGKWDVILAEECALPAPDEGAWDYPSFSIVNFGREDGPPTPPPRLALS